MLKIGASYEAIGPAPEMIPKDSKTANSSGWWNPPRVQVIDRTAEGYLVRSSVAHLILYGCEQYWKESLDAACGGPEPGSAP